jgi:hypothetical protein
VIEFDDIDQALKDLGKNRAWLAEATGRSPESIRTALAPNAPKPKRSKLLQRVLSDAIEEERKKQEEPQPMIPPGYSEIFMDDEQLGRADRASRLGPWDSLADFCRDAILAKADELLAEDEKEKKPKISYRGLQALPSARVAEEPKIPEAK